MSTVSIGRRMHNTRKSMAMKGKIIRDNTYINIFRNYLSLLLFLSSNERVYRLFLVLCNSIFQLISVFIEHRYPFDNQSVPQLMVSSLMIRMMMELLQSRLSVHPSSVAVPFCHVMLPVPLQYDVLSLSCVHAYDILKTNTNKVE